MKVMMMMVMMMMLMIIIEEEEEEEEERHFFNLFIHILKTLHNQTKTNHLSQKHIHRSTIRINKLTDGHLAELVHVICTVLFLFLYMWKKRHILYNAILHTKITNSLR